MAFGYQIPILGQSESSSASCLSSRQHEWAELALWALANPLSVLYAKLEKAEYERRRGMYYDQFSDEWVPQGPQQKVSKQVNAKHAHHHRDDTLTTSNTPSAHYYIVEWLQLTFWAYSNPISVLLNGLEKVEYERRQGMFYDQFSGEWVPQGPQRRNRHERPRALDDFEITY